MNTEERCPNDADAIDSRTVCKPEPDQYRRVVGIMDPDLDEDSPLHPGLNRVWPEVLGLAEFRPPNPNWVARRRSRVRVAVSCTHRQRKKALSIARVTDSSLGPLFWSQWVEGHDAWEGTWTFPGLPWVPQRVTVVRDLLEFRPELRHPPLRVRCPVCGEHALNRARVDAEMAKAYARHRQRDDGRAMYVELNRLI